MASDIALGNRKIRIGYEPLTLDLFDRIVKRRNPIVLDNRAREKVHHCHQFLRKVSEKDEAVYGLNTGFGPLSDIRIDSSETDQLQYYYLRSHAAGVGEPLDEISVRAMLLLRAQSLAQGHSGVSVEIIEQLICFINEEIYPWIPEQGSVGASGDLAPLAHLALALVGEGRVRQGSSWVETSKVLKKKNITPVALHPKAGLALNNGTQFMTALGMQSLLEADYFCDLADLCGAMSLEVIRGTRAAFDEHLHQVRPHPGQMKVAETLRYWLTEPDGSTSSINQSHKDCKRIQDPYSFRCIPQVHGPSREWIEQASSVLLREINSVTDNPILFPDEEKIVSGGNFHGQIVAFAFDQMAIAMAELANISERRIDKLTQPTFSGLSPFLTQRPGIFSGVMILQYTAASLVSENKTLCHPASVDSIPTSIDKEDHVSMGAWGARKLRQVISNTKKVLAIELFCACQGFDLLRPLTSTSRVEAIVQFIRSHVPKLEEDRFLNPDIETILTCIDNEKFKALVRGRK